MKRFILSVLLVLSSLSAIAQEWRTFVSLDAAKYLYSSLKGEEPRLTSIGLTVGRVKRFGWYVSVSSSLNFVGLKPDGLQYKDYSIPLPLPPNYNSYEENAHAHFYNGETSVTVVSIIGGGVVRLNKIMDLRVGLGYGFRSISWKTMSGNWWRIENCLSRGLDVSAGMIFHIKRIIVSLDAVSYEPTKEYNTKNPKRYYFESRIGLGYCF